MPEPPAPGHHIEIADRPREEPPHGRIVALDGPFDVTLEGTIHSLQALDALILEATQELIQLSGRGRAILIEIAPDLAA